MSKLLKCVVNNGFTYAKHSEGASVRTRYEAGDEVEVSETTFKNLSGVFSRVAVEPAAKPPAVKK